MKKSTLLILLFLNLGLIAQELPKGFVYLNDVVPSIETELRYCSHNNFIGIPIDGYQDNVLVISEKAANALKKAQEELLEKGFSLKVFDAYRPQQAVNHFVRWARVLNDTVKKREYYPNVPKRQLFNLGYIASKSGHTRGSTVDLTLIDVKTGTELDMGSPYDFFGEISHPFSKKLSKKQQENRLLLRTVMLKNNFRPYVNEWWHFTLRNEPFPKTYFNFPVN
ncbi:MULTISPECIES: M15 family metallopeptidase [Tenacibaculum]|uniref:M15 family metallopeptidase n=1 Tax=Tenacibaculum TaxID=104267 RepID=UPI001F0A9EC8|nr:MULTISPECIES: M15 family metallopeptidase [Tenacibaculum]MCH3883039.1 M15 family metallopeptidase [Tenacibaculum aquimarinum]MDO6600534.1 M15 family metallopeptidase [Tenacibaculum sp. 1_MG-2023]